jgi:hypothetical protein
MSNIPSLSDARELEILREERESIDRDAAKLVLLAIKRGDTFWQEQLQGAFDLTIHEAEELAGV